MDDDSAIAEQRRLDAKSAAEVLVLVQGAARDDREALHRHQLEDNAAQATQAAQATTAATPQYPRGESVASQELVKRFGQYTLTTEHAGLLVVKCTMSGCLAWCSALAPHFGLDDRPVCGFHDLSKTTYRSPGNMTRTRRVLWLMYFGVEASGVCWMCAKVVLFPDFQASHIEPKCETKNDSVGNLRVCCGDCNNACLTKNLRTVAVNRDVVSGRSLDSRAAADATLVSETTAEEMLKRFTTKLATRVHHKFPLKLHLQLKNAELKNAELESAARPSSSSLSSCSSSSSFSSSSSSSSPVAHYTMFGAHSPGKTGV